MDNQTPLTPPPGMQQPNQFMQQPSPLPNATAVLVLGILSIVFCWCYGLIGIILGIIALYLSGKDRRLYDANPAAYSLSSFNNLKAGRICGIIGLALSSLYILFIIIYFVFIGAMFSSLPWGDMIK